MQTSRREIWYMIGSDRVLPWMTPTLYGLSYLFGELVTYCIPPSLLTQRVVIHLTSSYRGNKNEASATATGSSMSMGDFHFFGDFWGCVQLGYV